jgi:hypothetical protein
MHLDVSLSLKAKANSHTKTLLTIDMCQSVDAFGPVPLPAVEMALKPDAEHPAGGFRLDLDGSLRPSAATGDRDSR